MLMPGVTAGRRLLFVAAAAMTMVVAAPAGIGIRCKAFWLTPKLTTTGDADNSRRNVARRGIEHEPVASSHPRNIVLPLFAIRSP